jgi:beta-lactamase regulating signal transducer with metallopeptidase domain
MRNRLAVLTLCSMIAIAGAAGMSAQAQVPAPAGFLAVGTLALAQAPSAGDSSSGSQSSTQSSQSTTQSSAPSGTTTESRHESTTTSTLGVSPLWIAVGVIALVALIALIVAASRRDSGSSTTVVK